MQTLLYFASNHHLVSGVALKPILKNLFNPELNLIKLCLFGWICGCDVGNGLFYNLIDYFFSYCLFENNKL